MRVRVVRMIFELEIQVLFGKGILVVHAMDCSCSCCGYWKLGCLGYYAERPC